MVRSKKGKEKGDATPFLPPDPETVSGEPRPFGESPEEVREASKEEPVEKKPRKKREKKVEEPPEMAAKEIEQMVCLPLDFLFTRFDLPKLNEMERQVLSQASVPMWNKYGGSLVRWLPEITFAVAVFGIFEPRVMEMNRRRREKESKEEVIREPRFDKLPENHPEKGFD